ncbi:hypothetical protein NliqN6_2292 [Naganishia liquefaciens]|uniref:Uncharacterized protein n=1 Tax=Naganishia liquefaciens TaxID=104408 RepID=A0A8H3TSL8_9TREE|nr:hypothetical protein NliqN6_2292 [Naganishia liquefaciens]
MPTCPAKGSAASAECDKTLRTNTDVEELVSIQTADEGRTSMMSPSEVVKLYWRNGSFKNELRLQSRGWQAMVLYGIRNQLKDMANTAFSALNEQEEEVPTLAWNQWRILMDELRAARLYLQSNVCISNMHAINVRSMDEDEANCTPGPNSPPMDRIQVEEADELMSDDEELSQQTADIQMGESAIEQLRKFNYVQMFKERDAWKRI